jgi:hypothetical protein
VNRLTAHHHRRRTCMPKGHEDHRLPWLLSDHHTVLQVSPPLCAQNSGATYILDRIMTMIPVSSCLVRGRECVQERVVLCNWALCDEGRPIGIVRPILEDTVPVLLQTGLIDKSVAD